MSYLVLARKYRPQRFSELLGQEHVARTLTNAIDQGRVHHAFLFTGARGVGKTSAARILAKALCCEKGPTAEPCGGCEFCQEISGGRSVDVLEIDAASNTKVEETKAVLEGVRYMPARARRRVYIIDEVHMLSSHSFNALLKTLEEPPPHVVFIFATTEVHKIPVTILSRCQRYDFKLIPTERLTGHLQGILEKEGIRADADAVRLVARQAAGSVRDGLSLLDQVIAYTGGDAVGRETVADVLGVADRRAMVELADAVLARDAAAALRALGRASDRGVDLGQLARGFLGFLRDLEVVARVKDPSDLVDATPDELAESSRLAQRAVPGALPVMFDRWARAVEESARSQTPRLLLEMALFDLTQAEPLEPLGDLLDRLVELERRLDRGGGRPVRADSGARAPTSSAQPGSATIASAPPRPPVRAAAPAAAPATASSVPSSPVPVLVGAPPPANVVPISGAAPPSPGGLAQAWSRVRTVFEEKRPRLGALLAHAQVAELRPGVSATLVFADRYDLDAAEKARGDIEQTLATVLGQPTRLQLTARVPDGVTAPVLRAEVAEEADALASDRRAREAEARQHPMIRKAQDLFSVSLKEIKT